MNKPPQDTPVKPSEWRLRCGVLAGLSSEAPCRRKFIFALGMAAGGFFLSRSVAGSPSGVRARKVVIPIYNEGKSEPSATLEIGTVRTDYQRRGFFRIGLLPLLVVDGVSLEVRVPVNVAETCQRAQAHLQGLTGRQKKIVELRNVLISLGSDQPVSVRCRQVRFSDNSEWRLQDGSVERPNQPPLAFTLGLLKTTGPASGELECVMDTGTILLPLFATTDKNDIQTNLPRL